MTELEALQSIAEKLESIESILTAWKVTFSLIGFAACSASAALSFQIILYAARNKSFWG